MSEYSDGSANRRGTNSSYGSYASNSGYSHTYSSAATRRPWTSVLLGHLARIKHLRQLLLAAAVVLPSLLLGACTTNLGSFKEIYLLSFSYRGGSPDNSTSAGELAQLFNGINATSSIREVRTGYLGLCATADSVSWLCASSASGLASDLNSTGHTDPLNLLWVADEFRAQAVTPIFTFMAAILTFLVFTIGMVYPVASDTSGVSLKAKLTDFIRVPDFLTPEKKGGKAGSASIWSRIRTSIRKDATSISLFFMVFATATAFTVAIWQHLAAACSTALADELTFGAIVGRIGSTATAISWLGFVCAAAGMVLIGMEKGLRSDEVDEDASEVEATTRDGQTGDGLESHADQDLPGGLDEPPPLRHPESWPQMPSIPLYHVLQFMGYTAAGREWETRQQNTADWVRHEGMQHGFAETIVETEA
ncbi:Ca2+ regulator and membrane fusion protein fig1 domain-containing protein [Purpureocillium lavendulum]|uniref:Ca2+ regulator and membrane fusion protein fig1 domain-containing protein n=1 Tax=Purpureocillium lavendulum TaxID=1247861 RepID=A0AB34FSB6_9HYPO|nr:Ca2+ regulator and membrane fusion protein fig1 domain-containing protein [Purpureocillium lavendulum]